jgi:hypothetical protein
MTVVINGSTGISPVTAAGTSALVDGMTVGRGAGEVASNTVVGVSSFTSNTTGNNNTVIGQNSLSLNVTGAQNTAVGQGVLYYNTGSYNTAVGGSALQNNTTASRNTVIGYTAGFTNQTGERNTFVGALAGYTSNVNGAAYNLAVGYEAGYSLTTGLQNTFVGGLDSGYYVTTGSKNTILGNYTGNQGSLDIRTSSNYIVLSDGDGNPRLFLSTAGYPFCLGAYTNNGPATANMFVDSTGQIYRATSSLRYKRDVQNAVHGLTDVMALRPVTYKSKRDDCGDTVYSGFIAEEVHAIGLTEFVDYNDKGEPDAIHYGSMVSLLTKAIQELKTEFDAYKAAHP